MEFLGPDQLGRIAASRFPANQFPIPPWLPDSLNDSFGPAVTNTPLRLAHFLGQTCWESAGWSAFEEPDFVAGAHPYGTRWKGRGVIQVTWEPNYKALSIWAGNPSLYTQPELVATPDFACLSAAWYWVTHNLNSFADQDDGASISYAINGRHCTTLAQRAFLVGKAKEELGI